MANGVPEVDQVAEPSLALVDSNDVRFYGNGADDNGQE